ncbi:MAG: glycosyltransferase family 4 protein [Verrucomicrobiales bacterium]|nr:glycosyltransferase family 4 protein [Verrucomicrobiota bacterium JB025]
MKIVQILPEMNAGGVERGTLELGSYLVRHGHQSIVISNGGRMVETLENAGSRHIAMPVHRKSIASLNQVLPLRKFLREEKPDILHLRSRVPAWLAWLAWRGLNPAERPRLVTTVHGFYSVNAYSAIMTRGERVIAVSESVRHYILENYPKTPDAKISVVHRGVDEHHYHPGFKPSLDWMRTWWADMPQLKNRIPLLMPGRLTRWKGQQDFIEIIAALRNAGLPVHGIIVGDPHPKKQAFLLELQQLARTLGVSDSVTFLGHRNDMREIMAVSSIVYSLSRDPEAFGRVSLEALALGKPVIGYDHGGVSEQLRAVFPQGCVPAGDTAAAIDLTREILNGHHESPAPITNFTLSRMLSSIETIYQELAGSKPSSH